MSEKVYEPPNFNYSVKISTDQKCAKVDVHHWHVLNKDLTYDLANQETIDAYLDARRRLEREGIAVAPLAEK